MTKANTESRSESVIPWPLSRTTRVRPSNGPLANGHMVANTTTERIDAQFGFAKHQASDAKSAFIANTL